MSIRKRLNFHKPLPQHRDGIPKPAAQRKSAAKQPKGTGDGSHEIQRKQPIRHRARRTPKRQKREAKNGQLRFPRGRPRRINSAFCDETKRLNQG